jgi:hypothetical protein
MNDRRMTRDLARGLGWFSIGLGMAELLAPRAVARATGMHRRNERLLQAYGMREIAAGIGLLTAKNPAPWLWARVGGDALDLAALAAGGRPRDASMAAALAAIAGVTLVDIAAARLAQSQSRSPVRDYSTRSGLPRAAEDMRGVARADFDMPADMATPALLRPLAAF